MFRALAISFRAARIRLPSPGSSSAHASRYRRTSSFVCRCSVMSHRLNVSGIAYLQSCANRLARWMSRSCVSLSPAQSRTTTAGSHLDGRLLRLVDPTVTRRDPIRLRWRAHEVEAILRSVVDAHFRYAITYVPGVAEVTQRSVSQAGVAAPAPPRRTASFISGMVRCQTHASKSSSHHGSVRTCRPALSLLGAGVIFRHQDHHHRPSASGRADPSWRRRTC